MYFTSKVVRIVLALGMMNASESSKSSARIVPPSQYGRIKRFRLTPEESMGMNSDRLAILEVKNITDIKTNNGNKSAMM
jgi:hypothetical protein